MRKHKPVKKRREERQPIDYTIPLVDCILNWGRRSDIVIAARTLGLPIVSPFGDEQFLIEHGDVAVLIDPRQMTYHNTVINQRGRIRDIYAFLRREFNLPSQ